MRTHAPPLSPGAVATIALLATLLSPAAAAPPSVPADAIASGKPRWVESMPGDRLLDARIDVGSIRAVASDEFEVDEEWPAEFAAQNAGATVMVIETSDKDLLGRARRFYLREGYMSADASRTSTRRTKRRSSFQNTGSWSVRERLLGTRS